MTSFDTTVLNAVRFDHDWQEIEILNDLLFTTQNPQVGLAEGLDYILKTINHPFGLIFFKLSLQAPTICWIKKDLPEIWYQDLTDSTGFLQQTIRATLETGRPYNQANPHLVSTILPIRFGNQSLGVLVIGGSQASPEELSRWQVYTQPLARLLMVVKRMNDLSGQQHNRMAMNLLTAAQNTNLSIHDVQLVITRGVKSIFNAEKVILYLLDHDNSRLAVRKVLLDEQDWAEQESVTIQSGPVLESILHGQTVEVLGCGESWPDDQALSDNLKPDQQICTPLIANGQVFGAFHLINIQKSPLDSYELSLLLSLSTALANALLNRQLFHSLSVANGNLEASRWEITNSRNTLRTLFDSMPASIYIVDPMYTLIAVNLSRAKKADKRPGRLVGRRCFDIFFQRDEPCPGCRVQETFQYGKSTARQAVDQQALEWEINTFPIINEQTGVTERAIILEQDITEKQLMEANLIQSEKLAAIGQLAAGIAHEINNPLAAIVANAQLMERDLDPKADADLKESVELILMAGTRAAQVVSSLLNFARKDHPQTEPFDLNASILNAVSLLQHEITTHPVSLSLDLSGDLPPLVGNRDQLQSVWMNLLMNAIESTDGAVNAIQITTRLVHSDFHIAVADTGRGIAPDEARHIFEPFYTTKPAGRGTGLGLPICYRFVKEHGGTVTLDSRPGKGTRFLVVLPAEPR